MALARKVVIDRKADGREVKSMLRSYGGTVAVAALFGGGRSLALSGRRKPENACVGSQLGAFEGLTGQELRGVESGLDHLLVHTTYAEPLMYILASRDSSSK